MRTFKEELIDKLAESIYNNYGVENYDEYRFGKYEFKETPFWQKQKNLVKKITKYKIKERVNSLTQNERLVPYEAGLEKIWNVLNKTDRHLLVDIIAYRLLGFSKVKLPTNNKQYWDAISLAKSLRNANDTYDPHFMHFILEKFNLNPIGIDINFYFNELGVAIDFINEQYAYKTGTKYIVGANKGDVVLDVGGCWGDTALYFAHKVGESGMVYSFEFIPENIKLHKLNTDLNPHLQSRIDIVEHPVSNKSDIKIYFKDNGPGSKIALHPFTEQTGTTTTLSIDDFVQRNSIEKVDFIKMDIEGAEPIALEGAIETIKKFRPQLAIAIYHSMEDFTNIPKWILDLNLNYEIYLGHYTIHAEETICYAKPRN